VNNLLGLAVMSYLVMRPMHPYEMSRTLRDNGDERSIKFNHGSLYMVVGQLEKAGFIAAQETSRDGQRPERTVYALTDAGRLELTDWMHELVAEPHHEYPHFVAALSMIAVLPPDDVLPLLERRYLALGERRSEISRLIEGAGDLDPLFLIEEEYRIALIDAEITFLRSFIDRVDHPQSGFGRAWREFHQNRDRPLERK
jgi:DNA-binding PadR family transcriptional regulator